MSAHDKTGTVLREKLDSEHAEHVEELALAEEAETAEHQETIWTIIKRSPVLLLIVAYANLGSFMFGFDNLALSIALSMPSFGYIFQLNSHCTLADCVRSLIYGTPGPHESFIIPTMWQSLWNSMPLLTNMFGAFACGPIADAIGRRYTFGFGALFSVAGIAVVYIARSPGVFLAGKMVNAISLGICLTNGQIYISEITPLHLRGIALSAYTLSLNLGYMVAASIGFARISIITPSGFTTMFAIGWAWPCVLILGVFLLPESPYYLVRKDNLEKAEKALHSLYGKKTDVKRTLKNIHAISEAEKHNEREGKGASFLDCFRGTNWRRTRIILYCNGLNNMIGIPIITNGPYFMVQAGLSPSKVAMMIEIGIAFGIVSSLYTFYFMSRVGRRKIIFVSVSVATLFLLMMGVSGCFPANQSAGW